LVVHKNHVKIRQLVITMVNYVCCCGTTIVLVKQLSPTQMQAIGYTNIANDLQLALGLSISLVMSKEIACNYYGPFKHCYCKLVLQTSFIFSNIFRNLFQIYNEVLSFIF